MTIKSVNKPSVAWQSVREIFNLVSSFHSRGKKSCVWCDKGTEKAIEEAKDKSRADIDFTDTKNIERQWIRLYRIDLR